MTTRHLSIRIDSGTFDRLSAESRRTHRSKSELAKTLLEEGLRMEAHPGIVFRPGPAGRRAGLAAGPDVWELVGALRGATDSGDALIKRIARDLALTPSQVQDALGYYAEFREEIDRWIEEQDAEAKQAFAAWQREQALIGK